LIPYFNYSDEETTLPPENITLGLGWILGGIAVIAGVSLIVLAILRIARRRRAHPDTEVHQKVEYRNVPQN
jgi:hypothetical protein